MRRCGPSGALERRACATPLLCGTLPRLASRFALLFDTPVPRQPLSDVRTPKSLLAPGDRRGAATHASAVRCAKLVDGLYNRPLGWSLEAAAGELGVSERSVERYVKACADFITDRAGRPRIEIVRQGTVALIHLVQRARGSRIDRLPGGSAPPRPGAAFIRGRDGPGAATGRCLRTARVGRPCRGSTAAGSPGKQVPCDPVRREALPPPRGHRRPHPERAHQAASAARSTTAGGSHGFTPSIRTRWSSIAAAST